MPLPARAVVRMLGLSGHVLNEEIARLEVYFADSKLATAYMAGAAGAASYKRARTGNAPAGAEEAGARTRASSMNPTP